MKVILETFFLIRLKNKFLGFQANNYQKFILIWLINLGADS